VIERIAAAHCDEVQSCNGIGPGAQYRRREDCMSEMLAVVSNEVSMSPCRGRIGEMAVSRCVSSLDVVDDCDRPGQIYARRPRRYVNSSDCKVDRMCSQ
jgi:hypothetical protein